MKKTIYSILFVCLIQFSGLAQAVLPTSSSFTTTVLPTGWTESGTLFYTASGNTPPAMKFDGTGDMLTINFSSAPGNLTYDLAGNSFANGTFLVEESQNGSTWTILHSHTTTALPTGTYTLFTDVPNSLSTSKRAENVPFFPMLRPFLSLNPLSKKDPELLRSPKLAPRLKPDV